LKSLGEDAPESRSIVLFDWRLGRIEVLGADDAYDVSLDAAGWDYRVVAPVLPGDIAVIGDPALYACAGDARLADVVSDGDEVVVTVLGLDEEVRLVGWSRHPISVRVWSPSAGVSEVVAIRDDATGKWEVGLDVGRSAWIDVRLRATPPAGARE
jgi:hypothetical protein